MGTGFNVRVDKEQMKILFINPSYQYAAQFPGPNSAWCDHELAPPLGLMAISAYIKQFGYDEVELLNGQTPAGFTDDKIIATLRRFNPAVVGITTPTMLYYNVARVARLVKANLPTAKIVLGGPHLICYGGETFSRPEFDFGVVGEGEPTFLELLQALEGNVAMGDIDGLIWKRGDEVVENPPRTFTKSLDDLPMPDFSLFDLKQHRIPYDDLHPSGIIMSSRGCPYRCSFCSLNYAYYRVRGPESVVDEMEAYKNMGYRSVTFNDDTFNVSKLRVLEICRLIQERRIGLPWSFRGRVDRFDDEMAQAVAVAGCVRAHFGVEAGTQEILDKTCKEITLEQVRNAFDLCRKYNISTVAFFILGHPGETREQAKKTIELALDLDPEYVVFTSLMPQPGSAVYQEAVADGAFPDYLREFSRIPVPDLFFRVWETGMKEEEIFELMLSGLARFYFRPSYLWKRIRGVKSLEDLRTKSALGLRLGYRMIHSWLK